MDGKRKGDGHHNRRGREKALGMGEGLSREGESSLHSAQSGDFSRFQG